MKQTNRGKTQILGKSKYQGKVTRFNGAELFSGTIPILNITFSIQIEQYSAQKSC